MSKLNGVAGLKVNRWLRVPGKGSGVTLTIMALPAAPRGSLALRIGVSSRHNEGVRITQ